MHQPSFISQLINLMVTIFIFNGVDQTSFIVIVVVNILRTFLIKQLFHSRSLDIRLLSTRRVLSAISYLTRAR